MTLPIASVTKPTSTSEPASELASASAPEAGFTIRIMSENEDSTLLCNTICTNKVPSYAAIGSPEFEAMAESIYGKDWRVGRGESGMRSVTVTTQGQLILDRIREMPEAEARRQFAAFGVDCMFSAGFGGRKICRFAQIC